MRLDRGLGGANPAAKRDNERTFQFINQIVVRKLFFVYHTLNDSCDIIIFGFMLLLKDIDECN